MLYIVQFKNNSDSLTFSKARFARVGSIVLALHDASDIFLELGKMTKYCGSNLIPSLAFIMFAVSWVVLRLFYFPMWIIYSTR